MSPYAFADSLRLPDAPSSNKANANSTESQTPVVAPDVVEKNRVILSPSEIIVHHKPGEENITNTETVENPSSQQATPPVVDDRSPTDSPVILSPIDLPKADDKEKATEEIIVNIQEDSVAQPVRGRPALTIEDILADPMKNNEKASAKNDSLNLPKDAQKMDFLEGKWRCETDLINLENNTPVAIDFTFDKNGKGFSQLKEKSGRIFTGSANATLKNGVLNISVGELVTPKGAAKYNGSVIQCRQKGSVAICSGKNTGNPPVAWNNATFKRIK